MQKNCKQCFMKKFVIYGAGRSCKMRHVSAWTDAIFIPSVQLRSVPVSLKRGGKTIQNVIHMSVGEVVTALIAV